MRLPDDLRLEAPARDVPACDSCGFGPVRAEQAPGGEWWCALCLGVLGAHPEYGPVTRATMRRVIEIGNRVLNRLDLGSTQASGAGH